MSNALILGVVFFLGYAVRDIQHARNMRTFYAVRVLARVSPSDYEMQPPGLEPENWLFCQDSPLDLDPGMTLKDITYEEMGTCKSLRHGGFEVVRHHPSETFVNFYEEKP